jgi:glycosyltransferase involved in cell wall biosynthesis
MRNVTISVVVCTYNRAEMLRAALGDLLAQATDGLFLYEIVVIDDASNDHTADVVAQIAAKSTARINYVKAAGRGYTEALNAGVVAAKGEWIAFFDDDQRAGPTWLRELFVEADKGTAEIVGGPVVLQFEDQKLEKLGPVCRGLYGEHPNFRQARHPSRIPPPAGGNRIVHRCVFDVIGKFDESFQTGGCDRDFLLRAAAAGHRFGWAAHAFVWHRVPADRANAERVKRYSLQVGVARAYMDWRHHGAVAAAALCIARVSRIFLLKMPQLILAYLNRKNWFDILDLKIVVWTTEGYARKVLFLIAPSWFSQDRFFTHSRFRNLRTQTPVTHPTA